MSKCNEKLVISRGTKLLRYLDNPVSNAQILCSDNFQDTTSHRCCRCDNLNLTGSFAVILQLQTKKEDISALRQCTGEAVKVKGSMNSQFLSLLNCAFPIMPTELKSLQKLISHFSSVMHVSLLRRNPCQNTISHS